MYKGHLTANQIVTVITQRLEDIDEQITRKLPKGDDTPLDKFTTYDLAKISDLHAKRHALRSVLFDIGAGGY